MAASFWEGGEFVRAACHGKIKEGEKAFSAVETLRVTPK